MVYKSFFDSFIVLADNGHKSVKSSTTTLLSHVLLENWVLFVKAEIRRIVDILLPSSFQAKLFPFWSRCAEGISSNMEFTFETPTAPWNYHS